MASISSVHTCSLLGPTSEVNLQELGSILSDSGDFFVVGVLGQQGVGKSSLLNAVLGSDASSPTLPVTSLEQLLQAKHCTSAATVASQPQEHIVAIDTWPIHSASVLLDVLGMERIISTVGKAAAQASMAALKESSSIQMPAEGMLQLMTLQLVLLLLSTCHLVVIMAEDLLDPQLMQLLLAADMLAKSLTDAWPLPVQHQASGAGAFQRMADVLLVQCNMCPQKMQPAALQELHSQVNKQLAGTAYLRQAGSYISCCSRFKGDSTHAAASSNGAAGAVQQDAAATSSPTSEPGVHLWVLPQEAGQHSDKAASSAGMRGWGRSSWHQQLVGKLLSWPRRMVWRGVSERDWAKGAERAYEQVRGSRDVIDFHIMAQRALYSNGGGWRL